MSGADAPPPPPEGFQRSSNRGAFTAHNGPFFHRPGAPGAEQAFFVLPRHCNGLGLIHGGMLSAFLDGLLASAVARGTRSTPITVHLSVDFLDMGRAGEWALGEARVTRASRDIAFAEGRVHLAGRDLARAARVFKLMRRRRG
ncbi:MAG: PaaI family thioesterase [Caulobacteraceae bacterium]